MSADVTSTNPVVQAIISGKAPAPARSAAARGLLPLPQSDLLEVLVHLSGDEDAAVTNSARETLAEQSPEDLLQVAQGENAPAAVLGYLASVTASAELHEAVATNINT